MADSVEQALSRAMRAEIKQGYLNAGAWDGFDVLIRQALPYLEQKGLSKRDRFRLRDLCDAYEKASPAKRKVIFAEIEALLCNHLGVAADASMSLEKQQRLSEIAPSYLHIGRDTSKTGGIDEKKRAVSAQAHEVKRQKPETTAARTPTAERSVAGTRTANKGTSPQKSKKQSGDIAGLQYLKGVGPYRLKLLRALGINSIEQLLRHFPRRYEHIVTRRIEDLQDGELATVVGTVAEVSVGKGRIKVVKLVIVQEERRIHGIWFNQIHITKSFPIGTRVAVTGKVQWHKQIPEILGTNIEKAPETAQTLSTDKVTIIPVYPETAGLNSKALRTIISNAAGYIETLFTEILPEQETLGCLPRPEAFRQIHFPDDAGKLQAARSQLIGEEALLLQLAFARIRSQPLEESAPVLQGEPPVLKTFQQGLPFQLTRAQQRAVAEISADLRRKIPMRRLLQGDVGSGKTVVAMMALLQTVTSGYQGTLMAPTEVLAQQHYQTLDRFFTPRGVGVCLLTGSQSKKERDCTLAEIAAGTIQVAVGTSALIQDDVRFNSLGLVVADEQHRFGVRQRTHLQGKGENPHVLVMTATPIPRTLALTLYGDLQLSVLDELPAGRKRIVTRCVRAVGQQLYDFMNRQMTAGRQIYVVCPLVEETENSDFISATQRYEQMRERFPRRRVVLVHGRMKSQEKESVMRKFREGEIDILVATTVVEVGVDVPNATLMIIENAERFGLAQLHQLRGRVGRGAEQSYCFLVSRQQDQARLQILCETEDGFRIAAEDLKLRGPGDVIGIRQHGFPEVRLLDLSRDGHLIEKSRAILLRALADPAGYAKVFAEVDRLYPLSEVGIN